MRKLMIILCFLYLLCTAFLCDMEGPEFPLLTFVNNSNEKLIIKISEHYPDTFLCEGAGCMVWGMSPKDTFNLDFYYISRDRLFKKNYLFTVNGVWQRYKSGFANRFIEKVSE